MGLRWILVESFDIVVPGFLLGITLDCGLALDPGVLSFGFTWQLHHLFQLSLTGPLPVRGTTSLGLPSMKCPLPIMLPQSFEGFIWITTGSANFGIFGFLWITLDYGAAANSGFWMPT